MYMPYTYTCICICICRIHIHANIQLENNALTKLQPHTKRTSSSISCWIDEDIGNCRGWIGEESPHRMGPRLKRRNIGDISSCWLHPANHPACISQLQRNLNVFSTHHCRWCRVHFKKMRNVEYFKITCLLSFLSLLYLYFHFFGSWGLSLHLLLCFRTYRMKGLILLILLPK